MYTLPEILSIIQSEGLEKTLKDISSESIKDPTFRDIWEDARLAIDKIDDFLDGVTDFDDEDDPFDDIDYDEDDDSY